MAVIYWTTLVLMLLTCVSGQTTLKTTNSACEDGWIYHNKYCFLIRNEYKRFQKAQSTCYMFGGNLPYGHTQSDLDFLIKTVKSYNTYGWWYGAKINYYDSQMEIERFGQRDLHLPATVPRPKTKQLKPPTSGCVGLLVDPDVYPINYIMISVPCTVTLPYACRGVPSSLQQSIRADTNHTTVPDIFDAYWFSDPLDKRSYADAQISCIEKSMTLISIKDMDAAKNISGEFRRRQHSSGDPWWIGLSVTAGAYSWQAPGIALIPDVLVWSRTEKNQYYHPPACRILLNDGTMDERGCYQVKAPFICQRYEQASGSFGCPLNWFRAGQSCYHIGRYNYLSHDDAQAMCTKTNSHLVSVDTLEELIWLKDSQAMENVYRFWTSLNDKAALNTFVWADGSKPDPNLVKWSKGDYMDGRYKCFGINSNDLSIERTRCEDTLHPGCQYKSTTGGCVSKNWKYSTNNNNNCYYVEDYSSYSNKMVPYNTMLQNCYGDAMKYDSSIEIVPLKIDSKAVLNLYKTTYYTYIWIGLSETEKDVFVWADGTKADMSLFDQSASRKDNSTRRCTTMSTNGLFHLENCKSGSEQTLCEKEIPYHH